MGNKKISKEDAIKRKKQGIRSLNGLLESYINSDNEKLYKKAFNISSWIHSYTNYLYFESCFIPAKNIAYKRGDVVKVNLGYNVGNELGGIHYAVVIDKENKHHSGMITIVPLSSRKDRIYKRDIDLGNDLYKQLNNKLTTLKKSANEENEKLEKLIQLIEVMAKNQLPDKNANKTNVEKAEQVFEQIRIQQTELLQEIELLKNMQSEIDRMKTGSIAKVEQITSISKIRILDPKQTGDVLHNISLSATSMKLINSRLQELYLFNNGE